MSRLWRLLVTLFKLALVLLVIVVIATGGLLSWLVVRGFPQREGTVLLPALAAEVRVAYDENGIANIYAATSEDLFAAQGWVHASERMWQMEVWRRIGAGRLAELFGRSQLDTDRYIRTLGWRQAAAADWEVMSDQGRLAVESYARGVNAWLDAHNELPLPFVITGLQGAGGGLAGFRPEPWTPLDTLTWQKVQAWSLGGNMDSELLRMLLLKRGLTTAQIAELTPEYDVSRPVIVPDAGDQGARSNPDRPTAPIASGLGPATSSTAHRLLDINDRLRSTIALAGGGAALAGSNGIAISAARSASGDALLANDPHLGFSMPSIWYMVGLHCRPVSADCPYEVAGVGFPGVPGIVLGHNARIAWGMTNVGPDVQDLFEERLDPADDGRYMYKGESRALGLRPETIKIAGADSVSFDVRSTIHGPVISDVTTDLRADEESGMQVGRAGHVYALAWPATMAPDRTLDAVLAINTAQDWTEFRDALRNFGGPSQSVLYADVDGHIGVQIPGRLPIRAAGDGRFIAPGENGTHDWTGYIPFDELPYAFDPLAGVIVAANHMPAGPGYRHWLGGEFDPGHRAARIRELLDSADEVTTDTLRAIQGDVKLTRATPVLAALIGVTATTPDGELLRQSLLDWRPDLRCDLASTGCAGYETFEFWLERGIFGDELGNGESDGDAGWRYAGNELAFEFVARLAGDPDSAWWDDTGTPPTETREQVMAAALDGAAGELRVALGDPANWTWGRIHTVNFREQTLGESGIAPLEWLFNKGAYPAPGSCTTVNKICGWTPNNWPVEGVAANLQERFGALSGPSYRLVIDMSDLGGAMIQGTTGQSGVPFDGHYGDLIDDWLRNEPLPLRWTDDAVDNAATQILTLVPEAPAGSPGPSRSASPSTSPSAAPSPSP